MVTTVLPLSVWCRVAATTTHKCTCFNPPSFWVFIIIIFLIKYGIKPKKLSGYEIIRPKKLSGYKFKVVDYGTNCLQFVIMSFILKKNYKK